MQIKVNMSKDACSVVSFIATDVAAVGIWDECKLSWVDSDATYFGKFNKIFTEEVPEIAENLIVTETNGDGNYKVSLNFNTGLDSMQKEALYKSELGIKFTTTGVCRLGSPEFVGHQDVKAIEQNRIDVFEIAGGSYIVDAYSILVKDASGNPQFVEYVFCFWSVEKYPGNKAELKSITKALKLKYTREPLM